MHHFKTCKCMTFQCTICRFVTCNLHQLYFFKLPMALDPACNDNDNDNGTDNDKCFIKHKCIQ